MAVLGLSTNTRLVSGAIIHNQELIDYFTHLHKASWSPAKADQIIASLEPCVRQYCIKRVILSIPYAYHQTKAHRFLMEALTRSFQANHITVITKTPAAFAVFCPEGKTKSKKAVMRTMADRFPELRRCYEKELRNKNKYYYKLFEAVAGAVLGSEESE